jgi:hypothetical protein
MAVLAIFNINQFYEPGGQEHEATFADVDAGGGGGSAVCASGVRPGHRNSEGCL